MLRLNLGCGANAFVGWCNVDKTDVEHDYFRHLRDAPDGFVWPEPQRALAAHVKAGKPLEFIRHDVRKGLTLWGDNSVDAIYIGQMIEHLNRRTEAPRLLRECCRVLKQYGVIKLTTPDLDQLTLAHYNAVERGCDDMGRFAHEQPAFYADADPADQLAYLLYGASGDASTNEHYEGHHHCYTPGTLGQLLLKCGFDVRSEDSAEFKDTIDMGMTHSFAIEGCKP